MTEKMDAILYLLENGYDATADELDALTLDEIYKIHVEFFGEDPTAD